MPLKTPRKNFRLAVLKPSNFNIIFMVQKDGWFSYLYKELSNRYQTHKFVCPLLSSRLIKWGKPALISGTILEVLANTIGLFMRLMLFPNNTVIVATAHQFTALIVQKVQRVLGRTMRVYLINFYVHSLGQRGLIKKLLSFLLNGDVGLTAQSPSEEAYWSVIQSKIKIRYYPYGQGPFEDIPNQKIGLGDYVFAGGYTNRDYDLLLRVANQLEEISFIIVCSKANILREKIPRNVVPFFDIDKYEFFNLLAGSRLVVIPLKDNVGSSGQMVALTSMQLGKAVIYSKYDTISQYFEDGVTGIGYVPGNEQSLYKTIRALYADRSRVVSLGKQAKTRFYSNYTGMSFQRAILDHIERFIQHSEL